MEYNQSEMRDMICKLLNCHVVVKILLQRVMLPSIKMNSQFIFYLNIRWNALYQIIVLLSYNLHTFNVRLIIIIINMIRWDYSKKKINWRYDVGFFVGFNISEHKYYSTCIFFLNSILLALIRMFLRNIHMSVTEYTFTYNIILDS